MIRWLRSRLRTAWQRFTRGYTDAEWWDLRSAGGKWLLPRLRHLRTHAHGYKLDSQDEWNAVLDEMIYAAEFYATDDPKMDEARAERGMMLLGKYWGGLWD